MSINVTINPISVAERVLELNELDDNLGILNIAASSNSNKLSKSSDISSMRKNYLKLSLIIHPDRMGKTFPNATKAFQALVKAFETLSSPELIEEIENKSKGGNKNKPVAISRSNEGCYRTRISCPRCKQPWSENTLDGNPDYFYNFLMTGLKQYTCSTCLCEFGCMTGIHKCPHCNKQYEYSPSDYHKKITCGDDNCNKLFGFMSYHASDRVIKEIKISVKVEQEKAMKAREAKLRRAERSSRNVDNKDLLESSFLMGLSDICPRCGEDFSIYEDEEGQCKHLMECTDMNKHKLYQEKLLKESKLKERKDNLKQSQIDIQAYASWQFMGADNSQLYLLNEDQLKHEARRLSLDTDGDKDDLINKIITKDYKKKIMNNNQGDNETEVNKKRKISKEKMSNVLILSKNSNISSSTAVISNIGTENEKISSIPSNYHSFSTSQLRSIAASQGLLNKIPNNAIKKDIISVLEAKIFNEPIYISD